MDCEALFAQHALWVYTDGNLGNQLRLKNAEFAGMDFSGFNLRNSLLPGARFVDCRLHGTDFTGASLAQARFTGCSLRGAVFCWKGDFTGITFVDCSLDGVNALHAEFTGTAFESCDLTSATFGSSCLTGSQFRKCVFRNTVFTGTAMDKACFEDIALHNVYGVDSALIESMTLIEGGTCSVLRRRAARRWFRKNQREPLVFPRRGLFAWLRDMLSQRPRGGR